MQCHIFLHQRFLTFLQEWVKYFQVKMCFPVFFFYSPVHRGHTRSGHNAAKQSFLLLRPHFWQSKEVSKHLLPKAFSFFLTSHSCWTPVETGNPSWPSHFQDGTRVWCVLRKPVRLWRSRKPSGGMWVLQPWIERVILRPFPHGLRPSDDAGCYSASSSRGSPFPALYPHLHFTSCDHLTDRSFT